MHKPSTLLVALLLGCGEDEPRFLEGSWEGEIADHGGESQVDLTIRRNMYLDSIVRGYDPVTGNVVVTGEVLELRGSFGGTFRDPDVDLHFYFDVGDTIVEGTYLGEMSFYDRDLITGRFTTAHDWLTSYKLTLRRSVAVALVNHGLHVP